MTSTATELARPTPATTELTQAFDYADDRSHRLDDALSVLEETVTRLGLKLEPVLYDGQPAPQPTSDTVGGGTPAPGEDRRSQVTRRVHGLAIRYDRAAEYVAEQTRRIDSVIEALEV